MDRDVLANLPVILAVARRKGFAAAAAELGTSASNVSHAVRLVEDRLGTPLFARTTRSVALTAAGDALLGALVPAMEDIDKAWDGLRTRKGKPSGLLRINMPRLAQPIVITPIIREMALRYPDVTVEAYTDDGLSDVVGEGFDAGIRLGEMIANDMVAVRLTPPFRAIVVASPDYVDRHGRPSRVADLDQHACIGFRQISGRGLYRWDLQDEGRDVQVTTRGPVIVNDALHAVDLALSGVGLAYVFDILVSEHLASGRLIEILPHHAIEEPGLFLYFPRRASMAPKLRAFITVARQMANANPASSDSGSQDR
jgi:DNA-binding transcriptional LysR family regulator